MQSSIPKSQRTRLRLVSGLGGIALLAFGLLFVGPWPRKWADDHFADRDPRVENRIRIDNWQPVPSDTPLPLLAGAASVDILEQLRATVPDQDLTKIPLAGYGKRVFHRGNTGVADPIFAKALVLDNGQERVVIVTADILLIPRTLCSAVLNRLQKSGVNLARRQIYFGATHTHSSIGGYSNRIVEQCATGRFRSDVFDALATSFSRAIRTALENLEPAQVAWTARQLPDAAYARNRTTTDGPTNDWLDVLAVYRNADRSLLASAVIFGTHATCRSSKDFQISADYPGILTSRVEHFTNAPCLFLAGCVGGMGPPEISATRRGWAQQLGQSLADESLLLLADLPSAATSVELSAIGGNVRLPVPSIKLPGDMRLAYAASTTLLHDEAWMQCVRVGDRLLIATPGDFGGEIALNIRDNANDLVPVITSFSGDYIGYILPEERYDLDTYESQSGCLYGPRLADVFLDAIDVITRRHTSSENHKQPTYPPPPARLPLAN